MMEMVGIVAGIFGLVLMCYLLVRAIHMSTVEELNEFDPLDRNDEDSD